MKLNVGLSKITVLPICANRKILKPLKWSLKTIHYVQRAGDEEKLVG